MPARKTIQDVHLFCKTINWTCLDTEYKGSKGKLAFICNNGHTIEKRFDHLQEGKGCIECSGKRKMTIQDVHEFCKTINWTCLDTEYKNSKTMMNFLCDNGHQINKRFDHLKDGKRCLSCYNDKRNI